MAGERLYIPQIGQLGDAYRRELAAAWNSGLGIILERLDMHINPAKQEIPETNGVPRLFVVKDGKVSTLQENGLNVANQAFAEAVARGEVFVYPVGERYPSQLQLEKDGTIFRGYCSEPVTPEPDDPVPGRRQIAEAVETAFGARRTPEDLEAEKEQYRIQREKLEEAEKQKIYADAQKAADARTFNMGVIENIYARTPVIREDLVHPDRDSGSGSGYTREDFAVLTKEEADLENIEIDGNGGSLTERQFAALAMFAAHDPEVALDNQRVVAGDQTPVIRGFEAEGYTEAEAKEIISACNSGAYSIDLLRGESRMFRVFGAVNGGRKKAAEALEAYKKGNKQPIAEILSRVVEYAGYQSGTSKDIGVPGYAQMAKELIEQLAHDAEIRQMAKDIYEKRDGDFCSRHPFYKHKTFEQQVRDIRDMARFGELVENGAKAKAAVLKARAEKTELSPEQKKEYAREIIRSQLLYATYSAEGSERMASVDTGVNGDLLRLEKYTTDLTMRQLMQDDEEEAGLGLGRAAGGTTVPTSMPSIISGALRIRTVQKAPSFTRSANPRWIEELGAIADRIVETDGLAELSTEELGAKLSVPYFDDPYDGNAIIQRGGEVAEQLRAEGPRPRPQKVRHEPVAITDAPAPIPEQPLRANSIKVRVAADESLSILENTFRQLGLNVDRRRPVVPESNGVPLIFIVKDGKAATLEENNIEFGSAKFGEAVLRGQVFAYPAGETAPVQLQIDPEPDNAVGRCSRPLTAGGLHTPVFPEEPERRPAPKWYQSTFKFWGNNRRICEEYEAAERAHREWEARVKEIKSNTEELANAAMAIEARFGASRSPEVLEEELEDWKTREDAQIRAERQSNYNTALSAAEARNSGIELIECVYGSDPQLPEKFEKAEDAVGTAPGIYRKSEFAALRKVDVDLSAVKIGGEKPLTEQEFVALALFGACDPDVAVANHRAATGVDTEPILKMFEDEGYSREDAKEVFVRSTGSCYSLDILRKDNRSRNYFDAVNAGKKKAAEALEAYNRGDKKPLAMILSRAVSSVGEYAGSMAETPLQGYSKLGVRALDLMERDPELKTLAKADYEKREQGLCARHSEFFQPVSFEDRIRDIRAHNSYGDVLQQGAQAKADLRKAILDGVPLTPDAKKKAVRDCLRGELAEAVFKQELAKRTDQFKETGVNTAYKKFQDYADELTMRHPETMSRGAIGGKGSSLPLNMPLMVRTGLDNRTQERCPVMYHVSDPAWQKRMAEVEERIIAEDGLDMRSEEELFSILDGYTYGGDKYVERVSKTAKALEAEEKKAQPEAEKKQEIEADKGAEAAGPQN